MQQVFQLAHGVSEFALQAFDLARLAGQGVRLQRVRQEGELFHV